MMLRVVVVRVLVHVHRRSHGGRPDQGRREQESYETAHGSVYYGAEEEHAGVQP